MWPKNGRALIIAAIRSNNTLNKMRFLVFNAMLPKPMLIDPMYQKFLEKFFHFSKKVTGTFQYNNLVKTIVSVGNSAESDYKCSGYVLINDLKLLICDKKRNKNDSIDVLTVVAHIDAAGRFSDPEDLEGLSDCVMNNIFDQSNLTGEASRFGNGFPKKEVDSCSIEDHAAKFTFYQNLTDGSDKLRRFVEQMVRIRFNEQSMEGIMGKVEKEAKNRRKWNRGNDRLMEYENLLRDRKYNQKRLVQVDDKTLLLKEAKKFFLKHYSSDKMLIALSKPNIEKDSSTYMKLLSMIPKRKVAKAGPYKSGYGIRIPNEQSLVLYFPMKNIGGEKMYSFRYVENFFFDRSSPNSFQSMLKESGLVEEAMTSFGQTSWSSSDVVFQISIKLTKNGPENTARVLELIFSYLNRIQSVEIEEWFHEKLTKGLYPKFLEAVMVDSPDDLNSFAEKASEYGLQNSIVGAPKEYDEETIRRIVTNLNAFNFNYMYGVSENDFSMII
uniref:Peptidase M16 C-terminal domain-containing protein n=1 Tax=Romanomermis culicivorax TaxID=13658 RepID=A0A915ITT0_ROMCU